MIQYDNLPLDSVCNTVAMSQTRTWRHCRNSPRAVHSAYKISDKLFTEATIRSFVAEKEVDAKRNRALCKNCSISKVIFILKSCPFYRVRTHDIWERYRTDVWAALTAAHNKTRFVEIASIEPGSIDPD